jgi:prepilin-type processing-associated H-X9-DG protein
MVYVLQYLEQNNLYNSVNLTAGVDGSTANDVPFSKKISTYLCPSDTADTWPGWGGLPLSRSNIVGCFSADGMMMSKDSVFTYDGSKNSSDKLTIFNYNVTRKFASIIDGTSNTAAISEQLSGPGGLNDQRGVWWDGWGCQYSHARTPNSNIPDAVWSVVANTTYNFCADTSNKPKRGAPCDASSSSWSGETYAARSYHPGGVNLGLCDGSVRFVSNTVNLAVWQAVGSMNGGEPVDGASY